MAQGCSDCDAANETGNLLGESEGVASTSQGGADSCQLPSILVGVQGLIRTAADNF